MKREIILAALLALCLTGCAQSEDPYRVDTVIYIPVDPTEPPETAAETAAETQAVTEPATAPEEEVPETTQSAKKQTGSNKTSSGKTSSSKTSSNKTSSSKNNKPKETEPPETKPAQTEPVQTQPPATEPPAAQVPETEVPDTGTAVTEPDSSETAPQETAPPETVPPETEPELYDISGYSVGSLERAVADQINACRAQQGLAELSFSSRLSAIASARGYEAASYWSHTRPDGRSYVTVLSDYGYGAGTAHEILTYGSSDAAAMVAAWMASESQKNKLLSTAFSTVGVGVYSGGGTTIIVCMLVG